MNWQHQEEGWYTSELGGICQERDRLWYFYPIDSDKPILPAFRTMKEAKAFAEEAKKR